MYNEHTFEWMRVSQRNVYFEEKFQDKLELRGSKIAQLITYRRIQTRGKRDFQLSLILFIHCEPYLLRLKINCL